MLRSAAVAATLVSCLAVSPTPVASAGPVEQSTSMTPADQPASRAGGREQYTYRGRHLKVTYLYADGAHPRMWVRVHSNASRYRTVKVVYKRYQTKTWDHESWVKSLAPGGTWLYKVPMDVACRSKGKRNGGVWAELQFWRRDYPMWGGLTGRGQRDRTGC